MEEEIPWEELLRDSEEKSQRAVAILQGKLHSAPLPSQQESWRQEVQSLADRVPPQYLTHHIMRRLEKHKIRVGQGLSFHRYMVEDSEVRKLRLRPLNWQLNRKTVAYRFVDALGIRRPRTDFEPSRLAEISWQYPGVLKSGHGTGSRGVYLLFAENEIVHVRDGRRLESQDELVKHANRLMDPKRGRGMPDRWFMEELILEDSLNRVPARDMKLFCFYGEVLMALEVVRDHGKSKYSFTGPDGANMVPGSWEYDYFDGSGPSEEMINIASDISRKIPHPFMRIDMLISEDEVVFGEFTPRPGVFQKFNEYWDRRMGEAWALAERRIQKDLLLGKSFEEFVSSTSVFNNG